VPRPRLHALVRTITSSTALPNPPALKLHIFLPSPAHTAALGRLLAHGARAGDVLCLRGDLGAGKTGLARGYVRAARSDPHLDVTSPTYLLDNTYPPEQPREGPSAAPTVHHMDLWRLKAASERSFADFDIVFSQHVAIIEWPDRLGTRLPDARLDVRLEYVAAIDAVEPGKDDGDVDDFWRFGGDDGTTGSHAGRTAALEPHGASWNKRVEQLVESGRLRHDSNNVFVLEDKLVTSLT
jgi:tRNA threonylcarbamoyladenosine biosynthesis protein TsaE